MSDTTLLVRVMAIVAGSFVSEDLAALAAGEWIRRGQLAWTWGLAAAFAGIFLSDVGVWAVGRAAARAAGRFAGLRRFVESGQVEQFRRWFDRDGWAVLVVVRFLPGLRVPLHLAAGLSRQRPGRFLVWAALAAAVWAPIIVGSTVLVGSTVSGAATGALGHAAWLAVPALVGAWLAWRSVAARGGERTLARWTARVSRLWRWEFWPSWLFYLPLLPWLAWLAARYRGVTVWTAANPGIPQGGVVGESKQAILARLPAGWTLASVCLGPPGEERLGRLQTAIAERGWSFPLILKPDAGQRGAGVRRVGSLVEAADYLRQAPTVVLAQVYHPGPYEAGVFYYRIPGTRRGRIFSITDKQFPEVRGDGRSSLADLIWRHPRYRMQASRFLARFPDAETRVPAAGERVRLALAGNHCQGTLFRDGGHLWTPALERRIDQLARAVSGFYIGRFDIRYRDPAAFRAGRDLAIVELNGVTSESTNIYDPAGSLVAAYRTLARQWELLFAIGHAHRQRGIQPTSARALARAVLDYYRGPRATSLAD